MNKRFSTELILMLLPLLIAILVGILIGVLIPGLVRHLHERPGISSHHAAMADTN